MLKLVSCDMTWGSYVGMYSPHSRDGMLTLLHLQDAYLTTSAVAKSSTVRLPAVMPKVIRHGAS